MDRLTIRCDLGLAEVEQTAIVVPDDKEGLYDIYDLSNDWKEEWAHKLLEKIILKLADYEDTNLTPAQLQEIDKMYAEKCKEVAKLEVYKDAINCFLNNEDVKVWIVWEDLQISDDVVSFEFLKDNAEEVGESIFFTRAGAEKALKEMKGGAE